MPIPILITGAGGSAGYNFIHSLKLKKNKYITIGTDIDKNHLSLSNADVKYIVPRNTNPKAYINALNDIIATHKVKLIHPQPDPEVAFIAQYQKQIHTSTFLPTMHTINRCHDKFTAIKLFKLHKVNHARSFLLNEPADLRRAFAAFKKDNHKVLWIRAIKGAGSKAALPVTRISEAEFWIRYWQNHKGIGYGSFMLSEFLPGKEYAFQSVWNQGKLIVSQARERQEYIFGNLTPSGQSSSPSVAVTVINERVNQAAVKAIRSVDARPHGVFCVDLKENRAGDPCVIEINPGRFFTTSNFFSVAGCNMPDIYISLALGKKIYRVKPYNNLEPGLFWLRIIDMGFKLINKEWGIDGDYTQ